MHCSRCDCMAELRTSVFFDVISTLSHVGRKSIHPFFTYTNRFFPFFPFSTCTLFTVLVLTT